MKSIVIIGIIVGILVATVFVVSEVIWYYANVEFEAARDEFKDSLTDTSEQFESIQLDDPFEESFEESFEEPMDVSADPTQKCSGTARCITGTVTKIVDGDTIHVDGVSVRFALSSAPELKGFGGIDSRGFIDTICPVGSDVIVDEDDSQTEGSFGRIIGVVYCNGVNLNSELLDAGLGYLADQFCDSSEFANDSWAIKHGC
jgi:micrococcal nuclease